MDTCLAYLITFSCYGARLHGAEEGSVNRANNQYGTPTVATNKPYLLDEVRRQAEPGFEIPESKRVTALEAILEVCRFRNWEPFAVHVRSNHVHVVVYAPDKPERVMRDFKAYATRAFKLSKHVAPRDRFWSRHGSTRYLWKVKDVELAIHYVVYEQGDAMAVYKTPDEGSAMARVFERVSGIAEKHG